MSSDINRVMCTGRLTRDCELRQTQGGSAILTFGIAVNDRRKNPQTGEWEDMPNFIDCVVFGNRATSLAQYLMKGTKVAVEGKLRWSQWEKDGNRRTKIEVVVDEVALMGGGPQSQQRPVAAPQRPQNAPQMPNGYSASVPPQMPPQAAPQQPGGYAPAPNGYQQQMPMPQAPMPDMYPEDIPFGG